MKKQLLKLMCTTLALLGGCVSSGGGSSTSADSQLCDGQQIETLTSHEQNREGEYTTTRDVITGECIEPEEQLKRGFEVVIDDPGNSVDLAVAKQRFDRDEELISLPSGGQALRWTDTFESLFRDSSFTNNDNSFYTGGVQLDIEFLISEDGYFRATTIADEDADHLAIFGTVTGQVNYLSFDGAPLRESFYARTGARSRYNSNIQQANFLAHMLANSYATLARAGAMTQPLANHAELFDQSPTTIKSYFKRVVFVIRSFIYHNRTDYPALEALEYPVVETWNEDWSPFGNTDRDPAETLMTRSYNIDYEDGPSGDSLTYLETWHGSHHIGATSRIRAVGHYGGDFTASHSATEPGSSFSIDCSASAGACELSTARNAGVAAYVKGFAPTRVEMELNNNWALGHTAVVIASFSDWDTQDRTESPARNNPNPLWGVIPVGNW
ncbi:MAG: hypothetical protein ACPGSC_00335 [Granulosicoccaceae bacterium]